MSFCHSVILSFCHSVILSFLEYTNKTRSHSHTNKRTIDKMTVDEMSVDEMIGCHSTFNRYKTTREP
jgi:hypothetical protein